MERTEWEGDRRQSGSIAYRGTSGRWKLMALEAEEVWVEMVTEGGLRFMAAWRK